MSLLPQAQLEYLFRISAWFSQGINCVLFAGHQDETLSARAYVQYIFNKNENWKYAYLFLNALFFLQKDHCKQSHLQDIKWAKELIEKSVSN